MTVSIQCKADEMMPITTIRGILNPKNRNVHPKEQIDAIIEQFKYQGIRHPIIISKRSSLVVAGEGRFLAAEKMGLPAFPVVYQQFESEEQEYAFGIADNAIANWASLDLKSIKGDVLELDLEFNTDLLGIENFELDKKKEENDDHIPQIPKQAASRSGELYILGEHRLLCGDCTSMESVGLLMNGMKADMVFTDPPYNLGSDDKLLAARGLRDSYQKLKDSKWDHDFDVSKVFPSLESVLSDNSSVYVCTSHFLFGKIQEWLLKWGDVSSYIVWCKSNPMPSLTKRHWTWNNELICYGTRGKHTFNFPKHGHALSAWNFQKSQKNDLHPTMKPVELCEHAITHSSKKDQLVVDLFLGSGSTLIACEKTNRKCYGMEIDPLYVDVILDRWAKFTGKDPVRFDGKLWRGEKCQRVNAGVGSLL